MRRMFRLFLLLALPFAIGCGDDDPAGPSADDLVGTWNATVIEVVSVANPNVHFDLIDLGLTSTLVLEQDGDFVLSFVDPEIGIFGATGTWSLTDVVTLEFTPGEFQGEWQFEVDLSGDTLRLTGADTEYDFDGNDTEDAAKLNMTLVRD